MGVACRSAPEAGRTGYLPMAAQTRTLNVRGAFTDDQGPSGETPVRRILLSLGDEFSVRSEAQKKGGAAAGLSPYLC